MMFDELPLPPLPPSPLWSRSSIACLTPSDELPAGVDDVNDVTHGGVSFHARNGPSIHERVPVPEEQRRRVTRCSKARQRVAHSEMSMTGLCAERKHPQQSKGLAILQQQ